MSLEQHFHRSGVCNRKKWLVYCSVNYSWLRVGPVYMDLGKIPLHIIYYCQSYFVVRINVSLYLFISDRNTINKGQINDLVWAYHYFRDLLVSDRKCRQLSAEPRKKYILSLTYYKFWLFLRICMCGKKIFRACGFIFAFVFIMELRAGAYILGGDFI